MSIENFNANLRQAGRVIISSIETAIHTVTKTAENVLWGAAKAAINIPNKIGYYVGKAVSFIASRNSSKFIADSIGATVGSTVMMTLYMVEISLFTGYWPYTLSVAALYLGVAAYNTWYEKNHVDVKYEKVKVCHAEPCFA